MKRIYIACPITKGDLLHNIKQADEAAGRLIKAGFAVFNPVLGVYQGGARIALGDDTFAYAKREGHQGIDHGQWVGMDLAWIDVSDAVLRLPGESVGADTETHHADKKRIPVFQSVEDVIEHFTPKPPLHPWLSRATRPVEVGQAYIGSLASAVKEPEGPYKFRDAPGEYVNVRTWTGRLLNMPVWFTSGTVDTYETLEDRFAVGQVLTFVVRKRIK